MIGFHFQLLIIPNFSFLHSVKGCFVYPMSPFSFSTNEDILSLENFFITIFFRMLQPYPKNTENESQRRGGRILEELQKRGVSIYNREKYFNLLENGEWARSIVLALTGVIPRGYCGWQGRILPNTGPSHTPRGFLRFSSSPLAQPLILCTGVCLLSSKHSQTFSLSATVDANKRDLSLQVEI